MTNQNNRAAASRWLGVIVAGAVSLGLASMPRRATGQSLDRPTAEGWSVWRNWDAVAEREYGAFVAAIGRGVAQRRCATLAACLNNPAINPLYQAGVRAMHFHAD